MKNTFLILLLVFGISACSEKRESDIDTRFGTNPSNVNPAGLQAFPTNESTPKNTQLSDTVLFSPAQNAVEAPVFTVITQPTNGSVTLNPTTGAYVYVPNNNYVGLDQFTWQVEQDGQTAQSIVKINVTQVNQAPVTGNSNVVGNEDSPITGTLVASDPNNDPLTYVVTTQTQHGTLVINPNGTFTYTPNANYNGPDSFSFKANDGSLDSNISTVSFTVNPVNDAPVANNASINVVEDVAYNGSLTGSDVDGNPLTYAIVTQPLNGSVSINPNTGAYVYAPNNNYNGSDSFTFKVNDGTADSPVATISIMVSPANDAPIALASNFATNEDTPYNGVLNAVDADGNNLTYVLVSSPTKGVISLTNANLGTFTYVPNLNQTGLDSFTFKVNDGSVDSNTVTVTVQINPINDAPVANNGNFSVNAGATYNGTLSASDVDSPVLTYAAVSYPTKGTLTVNANGTYTYVANAGVSGTDSFTFKANDGIVDSNVATITVFLNAVNQAPVAANKSVTIGEDGSLNSFVTATDPESSPLTYAVVTPPANGTLTFNSDGTFTYAPNTNFFGADSFTFKANDGQLDSNIASVSISVTAVNDAPVANNANYVISEDQSVTATFNASDAENSPLTYTIVSQPTNGVVTLSGNSFTYTPNSDYNGSDSFTFKANDGSLDSNVATIAIQINGQNDVPVIANQNLTTPEDTPINSTFQVTDSDGPTLTNWTIVNQPTKGVVTITNPSTGAYTYTPNLNANGADSFTVQVSDSIVTSNIATININITPVNDAPVAMNDSFSVNQGQSYSGNLQATDVDSLSLTYAVVTNPTQGTVSVNSATGAYTYTANIGATGVDSFTFRANDGSLNSNTATITINLNLLNIAPIANNQNVTTPEDSALSGQLTASDLNGDTLTYSVVAQPTSGSVVINSDGSFTYTPAPHFNGTDSFTFRANDGIVNSNVATVVVSVTPVNDAPVAVSQTFPVSQSIAFNGQATATDVDSPSLTYTVLTQPTQGTLVFNPDGTFTYTPGVNATGTDSLTFKANDGSLDSNTATISFQINGLNQTPVANNANLTTSEDVPLSGQLVATDANNGDTLTYSAVTGPLHGVVLVNANGSFTYTPSSNYFGPDSFTFKVNDGTTDSNIATVNISVTPVNDAPVSSNFAFTTNEDVPYSATISSSDVENSPLTYTVVTQPTNGVLTFNANGTFTYTPNLNYNGSDSFTFKANDGSLDSNVATASITVLPQNDLPVANSQTISNNGQFSFPITLTAIDADGDTLTYSIVNPPANGTLTGSGNSYVYTANSNTTFSDSFTFKANDGVGDSNIGTISINFSPVNPTATTPIAECIQLKNNGYYYARFGYENNNPFTVTIPVGANNNFVPAPQNRGQDTVFAPGRHIKTFKVNNLLQTDSLTWNLASLSAVADTSVQSCNEAGLNIVPVANNQSVNIQEDQTTNITLMATDPDGDILSYAVVAQPLHGTVSVSGNVATYIPNANYFGSDSFTFQANDGLGLSNVATVSITINSVNDAPVANNLNLATNEDTTLLGNLSANDPDGDTLTYSVVAAPQFGSVSVNPTTGAFSYVPNANYNGSDSFTFKVNDGTLDSNVATVSISVGSENDAPVANPQTVAVIEDTPTPVTLTGSDADGDTLTYIIVTPPANGTLSGTAPNLTYTPNPNFNGTDSFSFKVNDGTSDSAVVTVSLGVTPVNDAPVANNGSIATNEDVAVNGNMSASDVDGDVLTYSVFFQPTNGTLTYSVITGSYTYTPNPNFNGADSFMFQVSDGQLSSNLAIVNITVNSQNDAPVAIAQSVTVVEDTPKSITLSGTDGDGDALTYIIVTPPANGTLSGSGANITYTPNANFNGADSFSFKVNDGTGDSPVATISLSVTPVNDAPVASNLSVNGAEDTTINAQAVATDVDNNPLTYSIVTQPTNGVVTLNTTTGMFSYTPNANFNGTDSFTFKANDGTIDSNIATVSLTISGTNDAPVANPQTLAVVEDTPKPFTLTATDADGDTLTYIIVTTPAHGTITGTGPNFTYTPAANYFGPDSFTFKVNDGTVDSPVASVSINVSPVADIPVASNGTLTIAEDTPGTGTLVATDGDSDPLTYSIVTQPTNGSVTLNSATGAYTYTPNANFNGSDSFTFRANDGTNNSNIATIAITITPVSDIPVANPQTIAVVEDTPKAITLTGTDGDGDTLTYIIVTPPANGTLSGTGANITYTPNLNFNGSDSFTFRVNDGTNNSAPATISLNVSAVNDAPVASNQSITTPEDTAFTGTAVATDVDNASLTYAVVAQPTNGVLTLNTSTGAFTYTPNLNYNGSDSFTFRASDGTLQSNVATVAITVTPVNDLPTANAQTVAVVEDIPKPITLTGTDPDGNTLTYAIVTAPANGTISGTGANITYTPNLNFNGSDSFTFRVNDGTGNSAPATVSITVSPVNDAPVAVNQSKTGAEDTVITGTVVATDVDSTTLNYSVVAQPANGTITLNSATGAYSYTPNANYNGSDSFTFKSNDGSLDSNVATVSITVTPLNDAPVAVNSAISLNESGVYAGTALLATDADGNALTYSIVSVTGGCTATIPVPTSPSGTITTPSVGPAGGTCVITFKANDGVVDSNNGTITVTVLNVNNAPIANNQTITTLEDTAFNGMLTSIDLDLTDPKTYSVVAQGTKGVVTITNASTGAFTYTPNLNANGSDSFTFRVNDGTVNSNTATVTVNITPVNDAPVAFNDTINTNEDVAVNVILQGTDPENSPLTFTVLTQPTHGTLTGTAPNLVYTPAANYFGPDSFTFRVNDGTLNSNTATITLSVVSVNDVPIASNTSFSILKNTSYNGFLVATDVETTALVYSIVTQPGQGTVTLNTATGAYTYTPPTNYVGSTSFTFRAYDGTAFSNTATVSVTVTNPNTAPIAQSQNYQLNEDQQYGGNMQAQDNEGNPLTYTVTQQPVNGTLTAQANGQFVYVPNANYFGTDSFKFKANDGLLDSNIATINFTINSLNDIPVANNQSVTVNQNSSNNAITLTGSDVETPAASLTYTIVANPQHGTLSGTGANRTYTPAANYFGPDSFTFKVNDGTADSQVATVSITVTDLGGWCNASYNYSHKLMFNNQDLAGHTNLPVVFKFNSSRINYDNIKAGGADIRFYDSNCTLLNYEIERWNASGDSFVWVKVPTVAANSNASFIWMYYGNPAATDAQNKNAVWDANYAAVYHLEETSGNANDSTSNNNHMTVAGTPVRNVGGRVAGGELLNSSDDRFSAPSTTSLILTTSFTLESWVYVNGFSSNANIIERQSGTNTSTIDYGLYVVDGYPYMRARSKALQFNTRLNINEWAHLVATFNTDTNVCTLYVNGVQRATSSACTDNLAGTGTSTSMYVASDQDGRYFMVL